MRGAAAAFPCGVGMIVDDDVRVELPVERDEDVEVSDAEGVCDVELVPVTGTATGEVGAGVCVTTALDDDVAVDVALDSELVGVTAIEGVCEAVVAAAVALGVELGVLVADAPPAVGVLLAVRDVVGDCEGVALGVAPCDCVGVSVGVHVGLDESVALMVGVCVSMVV